MTTSTSRQWYDLLFALAILALTALALAAILARPVDLPNHGGNTKTVEGTLVCVPFWYSTDPTKETCQPGIETTGHLYYALDFANMQDDPKLADLKDGMQVRATGVFTMISDLPDDYLRKYPIEGLLVPTNVEVTRL